MARTTTKTTNTAKSQRELKRKRGDTEESPRKQFQYHSLRDVITVTAGKGDEQESFTIHQEIICKRSSFFKAALNNDRWAESATKAVPLPEHEAHTVRGYLNWCYAPETDVEELAKAVAAEYPVDYDFVNPTESTKATGLQADEVHTMWSLWTLGDYLGDVVFVNHIMGALLSYDESMDMAVFYCLYQDHAKFWERPSNTKIWFWTVDFVVATFGGHGVRHGWTTKWSREFLTAVLQEALGEDQGRIPSMDDREKYMLAESST